MDKIHTNNKEMHSLLELTDLDSLCSNKYLKLSFLWDQIIKHLESLLPRPALVLNRVYILPILDYGGALFNN